jgi:hypothetical protein
MPRFPRWATAAEPSAASAFAPAAQFGSGDQCTLGLAGTVSLGPNTGQSFQGTLTISIGQDGAIDSGTVQYSDGTTSPVVGQATGRSIRLRVGTDPDQVLTLVGSGVFPVDQCTGEFSGAFAGPGVQNVGVWVANETQGA